ncbi:T9SS type A sorting domain-containing protein [Pedobacter puniceum]|uniref:T9SS type A sorting domain-containing protein n=1 Tax=Pedobacter puniceum TaxID=2666136 RepID=A0A7K0FLU3_9SPHI|nr:T9SS type A sorting domain-containing protein [Pedobacter puniceum]MRX46190.1 T9SS type A sorting domain-containing protein [Pedobacter puniceum]
MKIPYIFKFFILWMIVFFEVNIVNAQTPVIKVDLNHFSGRDDQNTENGYTPWRIPTVEADSLTVQGVKIRFKRIGTQGTSLTTNWYKAGATTSGAQLVSDGVTVSNGNSGGKIEMRISGLAAGAHNLLVYLNAVDGYLASDVGPVDVYLNNVLVADNVQPTVRATNSTATFVYLNLEAQENKDIVIRFEAEINTSALYKNVFINAFGINLGDMGSQAKDPIPYNADEHVELVGGATNLSWTAASGALSHDVYFGTSEQAVFSADRSSPLYKGNFSVNTYNASNLYTGDTYYWRIDEVFAGRTEKGRVWYFRPGQLAFPGAEGFGRYARGGRGGKVVYVTNLNDSGPGSLREAITNDIGPRTIVFNVGGVIQLLSRLTLSSPYVTIAGQTAPGKGICLRKSPFGFGANDAIIRNMRLRLGSGPTADGMGLTGDHSIMDHCSISWTIDEAFSSRNAKNITLQRTLISEALNIAGHQNYPIGTEHGYAATIGGNKGSFHHNLLAHCYGRNWSLGGGLDNNGYLAGKLDIRNNVVYNWGSRATDGGANQVNFVNNYYKPGAGTTLFYALTAQYENIGLGTQQYYFNGNVMPGRFDEATQVNGRRAVYTNGATKTYEPFLDQPFFTAPVTTQTAFHAYKMVLSDVGANQPVFDLHDTRMVTETLNGTYSVTGSISGKKGFPDSEMDSGGYELYPEVYRASNWDTDKDGMPDWWENIKGLNVNSSVGDFSDANADNDRDGFTNLEDYLQWMAEPHYSAITGQATAIDIKELSKGFTNTPVYTISNILNGSASLSNGIVTFTASNNGLAAFNFTVTDANGHNMTRKVNLVSGATLTLPVTIVSFEASRKNTKEVILKWKTAQEVNNSHFEVLKSNDGENFKNLGIKINSKAPQGQSNQPLSYDFIDQNDDIADTYYQLIQKDKNGETAYSSIKFVKGNETAFKVWPIPSTGEVSLMAGELKEDAQLFIYDMSGRVIQNAVVVSNNTQKLFIKTPGIYILKVKSLLNQKELFTQKLIIN